MNYVRWAAWGVVDIEALDTTPGSNGQARRNYIRRTRAELAEKNIKLECGGRSAAPHYLMIVPTPDGKGKSKAAGGMDAFRKVCEWLLKELGDDVGSADGGLRSAGDEAQGGRGHVAEGEGR